jgi:uncharacterized protein (DUF1330 family)
VAGYVPADVTWTDEGAHRRDVELLGATLAPHGGEVVVADRQAEVMEGDWGHGEVMVLIDLPTRAAALSWYHSDECAELLAVRMGSSSSRLMIVGT